MSEHLEDGRQTQVTFEEKGFRAERDRTRGRWSYEITDEDQFARFAHRLTGYDALTNEDIEQLLAVARFARETAYGRDQYQITPLPDSDAGPYHPNPEYWTAVSQALAKADWA